MHRKRNDHHIPKGSLIYSDLITPEKPFFSHTYRLAGKPDYILKQGHHVIPIERKTGSVTAPKHHHILQLAAYCLLLEEFYNDTIPYGILVYDNEQFPVSFDAGLRTELLTTMTEMRTILATGEVFRNHHQEGKCRHCSLRHCCSQKLI